jgi:hypothetical protein
MVEILVALLITSILVGSAVAGFKKIGSSLGLIRIKTEEQIDVVVGSELMMRDFQSLASSFNLAKLADDCGADFFDYTDEFCPPASEDFFIQQGPVNCAATRCERVKTLLPDQTPTVRSSMVVVTEDEFMDGQDLTFTPASLFKTPKENENLQLAANEPMNMITQANRSTGQTARPHGHQPWESNEFLLIQTAGVFNDPERPTSEVKKASYLGVMKSDGSLSNFPEALSPYIDLSHPTRAAAPEDFISYLMGLPFEAGRQPLLIAKKVRVIRYHLQQTAYKNQASAELVRSVWNSERGVFAEPLVIASQVKDFRLVRKSVSSDLVSFKIRPIHDNPMTHLVGAAQ